MLKRREMNWIMLWVVLLLAETLWGESPVVEHQKPVVKVLGFADMYYVEDYNDPSSDRRQPFLYNHNRHDEPNVNLVLLQVGVEHPNYRSNIGIHTGTYSTDNYSNEKGLAQHIYEANIGAALNDTGTLWLDAGVFSSFIGFESAVSMDNWTLTRSLAAENSPYFFTGTKLTYTPDEKWLFMAAIVNGWQRIDTAEGNTHPSLGTQIRYTPSEALTLNWSTFIGSDDPDSTRRMRYFNNLYAMVRLSEEFGVIGGFDIGFQQKEKGSAGYDCWYTPVVIGQYRYSPQFAGALRAEYYQDKQGVIISTQNPNGFKTFGASMNFDYTPYPNVAARLEGRWLKDSDPIFEGSRGNRQENFFVGASLAFKFGKTF